MPSNHIILDKTKTIQSWNNIFIAKPTLQQSSIIVIYLIFNILINNLWITNRWYRNIVPGLVYCLLVSCWLQTGCIQFVKIANSLYTMTKLSYRPNNHSSNNHLVPFTPINHHNIWCVVWHNALCGPVYPCMLQTSRLLYKTLICQYVIVFLF